MDKLVTAIDLGSCKIAAALASISGNGRAEIVALESLDSHGIDAGDIIDINKTIADISLLAQKFRQKHKKKIRNVFVMTKGRDIKMNTTRGMVALSKVPREITKKDIERCLGVAAMLRLPMDRAVVQKIVQSFYVDGGSVSILNPIGLYGIKLEAGALLATANQSKIENITKCIDHAGLLLDGIYLSSTSCAESVLEEKEKEKGVLLMDLGNSLTEMLVFKENALKVYKVLEKGARDVLSESGSVDRKKLSILLHSISDLLSSERNNFYSVVVTGGGALLDSVIEETERALKIPARIGRAKRASYNLNLQEAIVHTSTIGLINRIAGEYKAYHAYGNPIQKLFRKAMDIYESYF